MIHIGFTGTRHGMTDAQYNEVSRLVLTLSAQDALTAHHGDCVGADAQFHEIVRSYGASVVGHPPLDPAGRAYCQFDEERPPFDYLRRNQNIVQASTVMIAVPHEAQRLPKGGTWYTVRKAENAGISLALVLPAGHVLFSGAEWPNAVVAVDSSRA